MNLNLIVGETRPQCTNAWVAVFQAMPNVRILYVTPSELHACALDIEVLPGSLAYERYGGIPEAGVSHILSTHGEKDMPPRVVTAPPFRVEASRQGVLAISWEDETAFSHRERAYVIFRGVFAAIKRFASSNELSVCTVGFSASLFFDEDVVSSALGVQQAYFEATKNDPH